MSIARCLQLACNLTRRVYSNTAASWAMTQKRRLSNVSGPTELSVTEGGKRLRAVCGAGDSTYHAVWLRHGCQCSRCVSQYKQLLWESHELDPHVKISDVQLVGKQH